jgi:hypothetical protein
MREGMVRLRYGMVIGEERRDGMGSEKVRRHE